VRLLRLTLMLGGLLPWLRVLRGLPTSLGLAIDQAFSALCHHLPERTLVLGGSAMCVCSRCAGLYAGVALAAVWTRIEPASRGASRARLAFQVGLGLLALDVVTQDLGLHPPWHSVRLATGALVGWAAAFWMLAELEGPRADSRANSEEGQRFTAMLSRAERSASRKAT
jgi:uncharacterized membrane protein